MLSCMTEAAEGAEGFLWLQYGAQSNKAGKARGHRLRQVVMLHLQSGSREMQVCAHLASSFLCRLETKTRK